MSFEIVITLVSALLIAVGIMGVIYPVLPGSLSVLGGILLWSLVVRAPEGWWTLGIAGTLTLAGMLAQLVLTGRTLRREKIPNRSTLWGAAGAVIGMFVIPVAGIFIGFAAGLYLSEAVRRGNFAQALPSTVQALKSMGIGMVIEFCCALAAGAFFTVAVIIYFATA